MPLIFFYPHVQQMPSTDIKTLSEDLAQAEPIHDLDQWNCRGLSKPRVEFPRPNNIYKGI